MSTYILTNTFSKFGPAKISSILHQCGGKLGQVSTEHGYYPRYVTSAKQACNVTLGSHFAAC